MTLKYPNEQLVLFRTRNIPTEKLEMTDKDAILVRSIIKSYIKCPQYYLKIIRQELVTPYDPVSRSDEQLAAIRVSSDSGHHFPSQLLTTARCHMGGTELCLANTC